MMPEPSSPPPDRQHGTPGAAIGRSALLAPAFPRNPSCHQPTQLAPRLHARDRQLRATPNALPLVGSYLVQPRLLRLERRVRQKPALVLEMIDGVGPS